MPPSLLHVLHLMRETRAAAREEGVSVTFPFKATDVAAIHSSFHKHGDGIYFRLKDGRVFSAFGIELDPNPARYADVPSPRFFPCMPVPRPRRST